MPKLKVQKFKSVVFSESCNGIFVEEGVWVLFYKVEKKVKILSEMIICDCVLQKRGFSETFGW